MKTLVAGMAVVLALCACSVAAQAPESRPLTKQELARCAARVRDLREESARLNETAARLDARRGALERRRAALNDDTQDDGADGPHARWMHYNADAAALNDDVAQFRRDVERINRIKRGYRRECAGRPYSRSDLGALPEGLRAAMRAGLAGVRVPYAGDVDAP